MFTIIIGADLERSGTGWDEIYYSEMQDLKIAGKKVAVFGLGDSVSYSENYADATGEVKFNASKMFIYRFSTNITHIQN